MVCKSLYFQGVWALSRLFCIISGITYYVINNNNIKYIIRNKLI